MASPLGQIEKKYEILEKLGEGGMGAVYKARHRLLDEIRVLKVMHSALEQDEEFRTRFIYEARTAVHLRHPNVVQIHDFAIEEGLAYLDMEFIEGVTLEELLEKEGPPDLDLVFEISRQTLRALGYFHLRKLVHRDISPDNIMLIRETDGSVQIKLIDLGIAKRLEATTQLTRQGVFIGKLRYASPEQFGGPTGDSHADGRSDIYSFGLVLYLVLTGRFPISGDKESALIAGHLFRKPLPFAESDPGRRVPPALRAAVLKALEKIPEKRFQTAKEFWDVLAKIREQCQGQSEKAVVLPKPDARALRAVSALIKNAEKLIMEGDFEEAKTPIEAVLLIDPQNPDAHRLDVQQTQLSTLQGLLERGELGKVREALREAEDQLGENDALGALRDRLQELVGERAAKQVLAGRRLLGEKRYEQALEMGRRVLDSDAGNSAARALLVEIEEQLLAEACSAIRGLLDERELRPARAALKGAGERFGKHSVLAELRAELELLTRQEQAEELVAAARRSFAAERLDEAQLSLRQALELDPDHATAAALVAEVETALKRRQQRKEHARAVKEAAAKIQGQLDQGELGRAGTALGRAEKKLGEDERFAALRRSLERLLRQQEVKELVAVARQSFAAERLEEALLSLRQALELDSDDAAAATLVAEIEAALKRRQQQEERARAVAEAAGKIRGQLGQGELRLARTALGRAEKKFGEDERLAALRRSLERLLRQEEVEKLVAGAWRSFAAERLEEALLSLRQALELDSDNAAAAALVAEVEAALKRQQQQEKLARAVEGAAGKIRGQLEQGKLRGARSALRRAEKKFGEDYRFAALRRSLERFLRQEEVEKLVAAARRSFEGERLDEASATLRQALELDSDNAAAAALVAEVEAALKCQHQQEEHARAPEEAAGKIRGQLEQGEPRQERTRVARAVAPRSRSRIGDGKIRDLVSRLGPQLTPRRRRLIGVFAVLTVAAIIVWVTLPTVERLQAERETVAAIDHPITPGPAIPIPAPSPPPPPATSPLEEDPIVSDPGTAKALGSTAGAGQSEAAQRPIENEQPVAASETSYEGEATAEAPVAPAIETKPGAGSRERTSDQTPSGPTAVPARETPPPPAAPARVKPGENPGSGEPSQEARPPRPESVPIPVPVPEPKVDEAEPKRSGLSPDSLQDLEKAIDSGDLEGVRSFTASTAWTSLPEEVNYRIGELLVQKLETRKRKVRKAAQEMLREAMRAGNTELLKAFSEEDLERAFSSTAEKPKLRVH